MCSKVFFKAIKKKKIFFTSLLVFSASQILRLLKAW